MRVGLALALLLLAPVASAAVVLEDPPGDVTIMAAAQSTVPIPAGIRDGIDIIDVQIEEEPQEFRFIVSMAAMDDTIADVVEDLVVEVRFSHGARDYEIRHSALLPGDDSARLGSKDRLEDWYSSQGRVDVTVDQTNARYIYTIPRYDMPDENGAPPALGANLTNIEVVSEAPVLIATLVSLYPGLVTLILFGEHKLLFIKDTAGIDDPGRYSVEFGVEQTGTGRLSAERAYRTSNGEAGTFVFWVDARHDAEGSGDYTLSVDDVPTGWAVQTPPGTIKISEGDSMKLPVIVETAFAHSHGRTEEFILNLEDGKGGSGRLMMGIRYPEVPQPAGHHNKIYLYSAASADVLETPFDPAHEAVFGNKGSEVAYMNAKEDHEDNIESFVDFDGCGGNFDGARYCMEIPLDPALDMGLDFITDEEGLLHLMLDSSKGSIAAEVSGYLRYRVLVEGDPPCPSCSPRIIAEDTVLASIPATVVDLDESVTTLDLPVHPTKESDYVAYQPAAQMSLLLNISTDRPSIFFDQLAPGAEPRLAPGGYLELPLLEYKDRVDAIPGIGENLEWKIPARERLANPGDVILFNPTLTNHGEKDRFQLRVVGHNRDWSTLQAPEVITLERNETISVPLVVRVPTDASLDATAELVLEAASTKDITNRALLQVRTALTDEEVPDDAVLVDGLKGEEKKSPGAGLILLVVALLGAIVARRRP